MQDSRTRMTIIVAVLIVIIGGGAGLWAARRPSPPPIVISSPGAAPGVTGPMPAAPVPVTPAPVPETKYYVHVAGAVRNPSLYLLPPGSRVMQAIRAAGGPAPRADLDAVNLAEKVRDGEKIYVPIKTPAVTQAVMTAPPGNSLGHATSDTGPQSSPVPVAAAIRPTKVTKSDKSGGKSNKLTSPTQGQVNINTAGNDQLQRLPGVGPAMAGRILAYRQQAGGFQKIEELQEITPRLSVERNSGEPMRVVLSHEAAVRFVAFAGSIGV